MFALLFYRSEVWKTTWLFRMALTLTLAVTVSVTRVWWVPAVAASLTCPSVVTKSDVILVENIEPNYLLFERAAELHQKGYASRVLVLVHGSGQPRAQPEPVPMGVAHVMSEVARLHQFELVPFTEVEPITMTTAQQVRDVLLGTEVRSVLLVSAGFRSRRAYLAYRQVLGSKGIEVRCVPVWGTQTPDNWSRTWHGIQEVLLQTAKLQYYRVWMLP